MSYPRCAGKGLNVKNVKIYDERNERSSPAALGAFSRARNESQPQPDPPTAPRRGDPVRMALKDGLNSG